MTLLDQLTALFDEFGIPPGDVDERLMMLLLFWRAGH